MFPFGEILEGLQASGPEAGEPIGNGAKRFGFNAVDIFLPDAPAGHQAGITQYPQVLRYGWAADVEQRSQLVNRQRLFDQRGKNGPPGIIGERPE